MRNSIILLTMIAIAISRPFYKATMQYENMTVEERAEYVGMTVDDFVLLSSVVEAESDRSDSVEGRVYIALTILNRVNDDRFPNTIYGVLTQSGQFSTVRNGSSVCSNTLYSDLAVLEAVEWLEEGDAPDVLFFNCIGYNYGTPYGCYGGNYFMTLEE